MSEPPALGASLAQWLRWLETIHPVAIDMGLERVSEVADRLQLRPVQKPLVLVGGTNGKGSTVAMLSAIYTAAGYRVGAYCSPHIHDFRERIRINGQMAEASHIVEALAFVEAQRTPQSLTYFEYTTLAAMRVFLQCQCDVYLLEVGLGGRLDATNIWDADCSVVTSIALDHEAYLGSDISVIATEKAAIGRADRTLVVGEVDPPDSLWSFAREQGINLEHVGGWPAQDLPRTRLPGQHQRRNAGCAVSVVKQLQARLPVPEALITKGLMQASVPARFERHERNGVTLIMDVAHNPAAARALAETWREQLGEAHGQVVFSVLNDKDIDRIVDALNPVAAAWHCIELDGPRTQAVSDLANAVRQRAQAPVTAYHSIDKAVHCALEAAQSSANAVLVAGSFHTIAAVQAQIGLSGTCQNETC